VRKLQKFSVVNKILVGQILIVLFVTLIFFILGSSISAKSALYGGLAALLPNWYFARKINKHKGEEARKIVRSFYAGESGKLLLTAMLFALIFQDPKVEFAAVFTAYISALTVFWFALLIRKY